MRKSATFLSVCVSIILLVASQVAAAQGNGKGNGKANGKGKGLDKNIGVGNASNGIMGRIITDRGIFYTGDPLAISIQFPRGAELITGGEVDAYVVVFAPTVEEDDSDTSGDTGSDDSGTDDSGTDDSGTDDSGTDDSGTDDSGTDDSGTDDSGTDDSGTDDSGTDDSDSDDSSSGEDTPSGTSAVLSDAVVLPVSSEASKKARPLFAIDAVDVSVLPAGTYQLGLILTNPGGDPLVINDWYQGLLGLIDVVGLTVADEAVDFDADGDGEVDDDADGDGFSDPDDPEETDDGSSDDSSSDDDSA